MSGRDVLERNLTRLLRQAWQPVLPRASFRERLRADFLTRAGALGPGSAARRRPRWLAPGLAAAAAAALALVSWWSLTPAQPTLEGLMARGEVASRADPAAGWSGSRATAVEFGGGFLELVTPPQRGLSVAAGADGLQLEPATHAVLRADLAPGSPRAGALAPPLNRIDLLAGGVRVERGSSAPLAVGTSEGSVSLSDGRARLAYEQGAPGGQGRALRVRAERGRALVSAAATASRRWVEAGDEVLLAGGRLVDEEPPAGRGATAAGRRQALAPGEPLAPEEESAAGVAVPGEGPAQVAGTVSMLAPAEAQGADVRRPAAEFTLIFLRQVALPQVADPQHFEFAGPDGRFALGGLGPGSYEVFARAPGCALWRGGALSIAAAGAPVQQLEIELAPGVRATGLVVDDGTGLPIADALVVSETDAPVQILSLGAEEFLDRPGLLASARSGPDGGFVLEDLSPGAHVLRASAPGHGAAWQGPCDPAEGPFELTLEPPGRIEGQVLDAAGAPVEGSMLIASLTDFGPGHPVMSFVRALTDAGGRYVLEDLPAGYWPLLSFGAVEGTRRLEPELVFVRVEAGELVRRDFAAQRAGVRLEGVLAGADGAPAGARAVWLTPADGRGSDLVSTTTDAQGRFRFAGLAPRTYAVFTSRGAPPDMIVLGEVDLSSGADVLDQRLQLSGARLAGRVLDGLRDEPVEYAVVVLLRVDGPRAGFAGKTFTGADGSFSFEQLEQGSYEVQVVPTRGGFAAQRAGDLVLQEGATLELETLRVYPGAALVLAVTGPLGRPAPGVEVTLRFEDGHVYELLEDPHTARDGRLRVPALAPGRWQVALRGAGFAPREVAVDVAAAGEPEVLAVELARP